MRAFASLAAAALLLTTPGAARTPQSAPSEPPGSVSIHRVAAGQVGRVAGGFLLPSPAGDGGWLVVTSTKDVPRDGLVMVRTPGGRDMFAVKTALEDGRTGLAFLGIVDPKGFEAQLEGDDVPPLADKPPTAGEALYLPGGHDPVGAVVGTASVSGVEIVRTSVRPETPRPTPLISAGRTVVGILADAPAASGAGDLVSAAFVRSLFPQHSGAPPGPTGVVSGDVGEVRGSAGTVPGGEAPSATPGAVGRVDAPKPPSIVRVSGGVLAGKAVKRVQPSYPSTDLEVTGTVAVEVTVDEDGRVISARAVSGHPLLRNAAVTAARQWEFTPTVLSGQRVKVVGVITLSFTR